MLSVFIGDILLSYIESARVRVRPLPTGGLVNKPLTRVPVQVEVFGKRQPSGPLYSILRAHGRVTGVTGFGAVQTNIQHDLLDRILGADKVCVRVNPDSDKSHVFWFEPHDSKNIPRWPLGAVLHNDGGQVSIGAQRGSAWDLFGLQGAIPLPDTVPKPVRPQLAPLI